MSDIVERLRTWCHALHAPPASDIMDEAADEIVSLREAIRRLAKQDATLSACNGSVTVTMDATLTDAEREAVRVARDAYADDDGNAECEKIAAVLSGLLERMK